MIKRAASAVLWLLALGWGLNYVSLITGAPPIIGIVLSVAVSAFVAIDPRHLFWPRRAASVAATTRDVGPVSGAVQTQV